jgi:hypothetical protein
VALPGRTINLVKGGARRIRTRDDRDCGANVEADRDVGWNSIQKSLMTHVQWDVMLLVDLKGCEKDMSMGWAESR